MESKTKAIILSCMILLLLSTSSRGGELEEAVLSLADKIAANGFPDVQGPVRVTIEPLEVHYENGEKALADRLSVILPAVLREQGIDVVTQNADFVLRPHLSMSLDGPVAAVEILDAKARKIGYAAHPLPGEQSSTDLQIIQSAMGRLPVYVLDAVAENNNIFLLTTQGLFLWNPDHAVLKKIISTDSLAPAEYPARDPVGNIILACNEKICFSSSYIQGTYCFQPGREDLIEQIEYEVISKWRDCAMLAGKRDKGLNYYHPELILYSLKEKNAYTINAPGPIYDARFVNNQNESCIIFTSLAGMAWICPQNNSDLPRYKIPSGSEAIMARIGQNKKPMLLTTSTAAWGLPDRVYIWDIQGPLPLKVWQSQPLEHPVKTLVKIQRENLDEVFIFTPDKKDNLSQVYSLATIQVFEKSEKQEELAQKPQKIKTPKKQPEEKQPPKTPEEIRPLKTLFKWLKDILVQEP